MVDEHISLKEGNRWLYRNLAAVALTSKVEVHYRNAQKLSVGTDISWHWDLALLGLVLLIELFETLRWAAQRRDRDILNDQVSILEVRLRVVWAEEDFEFNGLVAFDLALLGVHSVVSLLVTKRDFV